MAAVSSLFGWHVSIHIHYSASNHCFGITCHVITPSFCQTVHNVMGPTQVSMANVVKTVDSRDARISVVWQLVMVLSSSCSNMLAVPISFGTVARICNGKWVCRSILHMLQKAWATCLAADRAVWNFFRWGFPPHFHCMVCLSLQTVVMKLFFSHPATSLTKRSQCCP